MNETITPPVMYIVSPGFHRVVDDASVVIRGYASDETAPDVTVAISNNGQAYAPTMNNGAFTREIPLDVGVNNIEITATDGAGLTTTVEIYMIRLITDRAQSDLEYLRGLIARGQANWTAEETEWFLRAVSKGAYNYTDLNRVNAAVRYLKQKTDEHGYNVKTNPTISKRLAYVLTDSSGYPIVDSESRLVASPTQMTGEVWTESDKPTRGPMEIYRKNVVAIRDAQRGLVPAPLPSTMRKSGIEDWNNIEKALVAADALLEYYRNFYSGEIVSGEF